jgi:hypothetical protein
MAATTGPLLTLTASDLMRRRRPCPHWRGP